MEMNSPQSRNFQPQFRNPPAMLATLNHKRRLILNPLIACVALAVMPVAFAGLDEGLAALRNGDDVTAIKEIRPLAERGNAQAQMLLGYIYLKGRGVPKDDNQAVAWYRKAADQGDAEAQFNLGFMYFNGRGVSKDGMLAYFWFLLSSTQGYANATKNRDIIERQITPSQRAEAQTLARNWKPNTR